MFHSYIHCALTSDLEISSLFNFLNWYWNLRHVNCLYDIGYYKKYYGKFDFPVLSRLPEQVLMYKREEHRPVSRHIVHQVVNITHISLPRNSRLHSDNYPPKKITLRLINIRCNHDLWWWDVTCTAATGHNKPLWLNA